MRAYPDNRYQEGQDPSDPSGPSPAVAALDLLLDLSLELRRVVLLGGRQCHDGRRRRRFRLVGFGEPLIETLAEQVLLAAAAADNRPDEPCECRRALRQAALGGEPREQGMDPQDLLDPYRESVRLSQAVEEWFDALGRDHENRFADGRFGEGADLPRVRRSAPRHMDRSHF
jgi:hypothetical protein